MTSRHGACAFCGVDLDRVAWALTREARGACRECVDREGLRVMKWMASDPRLVVTDLGDATVDGGRVVLGPELHRRAVEAGVERRLGALARGRRNAHGFTGWNAWDVDIEGACAELAASVWLRRPWAPVVGELDTEQGDLGDGIQVRSTGHEDGHLLVHPSDADDHRFVLVVGRSPSLRVAGWLWGREAKRDEWWIEAQAGRPCFMAPQSALRPVLLQSVVTPTTEERDGRA